MIVLTGLVNRFGDEALAGFSIGAAMIAMVGANIGAGQLDRAHQIDWTGSISAAAIAGVISTSTALWPGA